jgi:hypothetical protein
MSEAYDVLMVEVGNMSKRQTTAVFDYVDELRARIAALEADRCTCGMNRSATPANSGRDCEPKI